MMPGMDGATIIAAIHSADPLRPIIASSGLTENGRKVQARSRGAI